jgi:hypothetical protein
LSRALASKAAMDWNSEPARRITSCTRLVGKARVACHFRELCQYGKSAAIEFAFKDGRALREWTPTEGKETAPWD